MKIIQLALGYCNENRSNNIARLCTWPGVRFGTPVVYKVRPECSLSNVTPVIGNGSVLRLSDEQLEKRSKKAFKKT